MREWQEVRKELFTPEEIAESDLRVALIGELIKARQEKGITQKQLEELSGVKQPVIARMEKGTSIPKVDTILKSKTMCCLTFGVIFRLMRFFFGPRFFGRPTFFLGRVTTV